MSIACASGRKELERQQQLESESEQQHNDEHDGETEPESVATLHNDESYAESGTEELSEGAIDERQLERLLRLEAEAEQERQIQLNRLAELEAEAAEEREAGKWWTVDALCGNCAGLKA